jgi:hypothetical protein
MQRIPAQSIPKVSPNHDEDFLICGKGPTRRRFIIGFAPQSRTTPSVHICSCGLETRLNVVVGNASRAFWNSPDGCAAKWPEGYAQSSHDAAPESPPHFRPRGSPDTR